VVQKEDHEKEGGQQAVRGRKAEAVHAKGTVAKEQQRRRTRMRTEQGGHVTAVRTERDWEWERRRTKKEQEDRGRGNLHRHCQRDSATWAHRQGTNHLHHRHLTKRKSYCLWSFRLLACSYQQSRSSSNRPS